MQYVFNIKKLHIKKIRLFKRKEVEVNKLYYYQIIYKIIKRVIPNKHICHLLFLFLDK